MENNTRDQDKPTSGINFRDPEASKNQNAFYKYLLAGVGALLVLLVLFFILNNNESHYEKGVKYTREKQYTQAIIEFQKVEPEDKDFALAQSKINYINGLKAAEQGSNSEALVFLNKVNPSDEYYRESRLMIEKIELLNNRAKLENLNESMSKTKDTIVVKIPSEKTSEEPVTEAETSFTDTRKPATYPVRNLVSEFKKQFDLANRESKDKKRTQLIILDSLYNNFRATDNSRETNPTVIEINKNISMWMQNRIDFINKQLSGIAESNNNSLRLLETQGDSAYSRLQRLLSSK